MSDERQVEVTTVPNQEVEGMFSQGEHGADETNQVLLSSSTPVEPPVHSLPPEILLKIFHMLYDMEKAEYPYEFDSENWSGILAMTIMPDSVANVCTYWDAVTTLKESEFWKERYVLINLMARDPLSRLQRHLERCTSNKLRIKIWSQENPACIKTPIDYKKYNKTFAEEERRRMDLLVPDLARVRHRLVSLVIHTIFAESLPKVGDILTDLPFVEDWYADIYRMHIYAATTTANIEEDVPAEAQTLDDSDNESVCSTGPRPITPLITYTYPASVTPYTGSVRPFRELYCLNFSGKAFVSFCRQTMAVRYATGRSPLSGAFSHPVDLVVSCLSPKDGGDTPFTLVEFLQCMRLFCGQLKSGSITDVVLPLTGMATTADSPAGIFEDPSVGVKEGCWPTCTAGREVEEGEEKPKPSKHLTKLYRIRFTRVNVAVLVGMRVLFHPHVEESEADNKRWTFEWELVKPPQPAEEPKDPDSKDQAEEDSEKDDGEDGEDSTESKVVEGSNEAKAEGDSVTADQGASEESNTQDSLEDANATTNTDTNDNEPTPLPTAAPDNPPATSLEEATELTNDQTSPDDAQAESSKDTEQEPSCEVNVPEASAKPNLEEDRAPDDANVQPQVDSTKDATEPSSGETGVPVSSTLPPSEEVSTQADEKPALDDAKVPEPTVDPIVEPNPESSDAKVEPSADATVEPNPDSTIATDKEVLNEATQDKTANPIESPEEVILPEVVRKEVEGSPEESADIQDSDKVIKEQGDALETKHSHKPSLVPAKVDIPEGTDDDATEPNEQEEPAKVHDHKDSSNDNVQAGDSGGGDNKDEAGEKVNDQEAHDDQPVGDLVAPKEEEKADKSGDRDGEEVVSKDSVKVEESSSEPNAQSDTNLNDQGITSKEPSPDVSADRPAEAEASKDIVAVLDEPTKTETNGDAETPSAEASSSKVEDLPKPAEEGEAKKDIEQPVEGSTETDKGKGKEKEKVEIKYDWNSMVSGQLKRDPRD